MNCLETRELLFAFQEGEVTPSEGTAIQAHLAGCDGCRRELASISSFQSRLRRSLRVSASRANPSPQAWSLLEARLGGARRDPPGWRAWFRSLARRTGRPRLAGLETASSSVDLTGDKCQNLSGGPGGDRRRWMMSLTIRLPRWVPVTLIILVALSAAFALVPPLRTAAQDPLGIFRVKKFATITIDPSTIPSAKGDPTAFGSLTIGQMPSVTAVSSFQEAQALVGFPIRDPKSLPAGMTSPSKIGVSKEGRFSYTVDLQKAREYLAGLGVAVNNLPAGLDGAMIKLTIPAQVVANYGSAGGTGPSLVLTQGHSPVIETPPGLDVNQLRSQILALPGLPPELVSQLQSLQDWQNTAVIPLPKQGGTSQEVSVDGGLKGLLLQGTGTDGQALLWERSGIIYGLAGNVTLEQLTAAANSLSP